MTTTYRKLKLEDLVIGKSYTFYQANDTKFTATLYGLTNTTVLLKNYEFEQETDSPNVVRSKPRDWIRYAESEEFKVKINTFFSDHTNTKYEIQTNKDLNR